MKTASEIIKGIENLENEVERINSSIEHKQERIREYDLTDECYAECAMSYMLQVQELLKKRAIAEAKIRLCQEIING